MEGRFSLHFNAYCKRSLLILPEWWMLHAGVCRSEIEFFRRNPRISQLFFVLFRFFELCGTCTASHGAALEF